METSTQRSQAARVIFVTAGIVAVAIVMIAVVGGRPVATYPEGSPEGVAQRYLTALFDGDEVAAHAVLGREMQQACEPHELRLYDEQFSSAVFTDTRRIGSAVVIDVRLTGTELLPDPMALGAHEVDTEIVLEDYDGEWRIVRTEWPLDECIWR